MLVVKGSHSGASFWGPPRQALSSEWANQHSVRREAVIGRCHNYYHTMYELGCCKSISTNLFIFAFSPRLTLDAVAPAFTFSFSSPFHPRRRLLTNHHAAPLSTCGVVCRFRHSPISIVIDHPLPIAVYAVVSCQGATSKLDAADHKKTGRAGFVEESMLVVELPLLRSILNTEILISFQQVPATQHSCIPSFFTN